MKWNNLNIFIISTAIFQFGFGLIGPFYVVYLQKIGGSIENLGISYAIMTIFQSLFSYIGGRYSDKFGRKPLLIWTGYIYSILMMTYPSVQNIIQLYILQALVGIVAAISLVASTTFLADITHRSKRGHQIGLFKTIVGIAFGLAMVGSGFAIGKFGYGIIFYAVGIIGIISTILLHWIKETAVKKK